MTKNFTEGSACLKITTCIKWKWKTNERKKQTGLLDNKLWMRCWGVIDQLVYCCFTCRWYWRNVDRKKSNRYIFRNSWQWIFCWNCRKGIICDTLEKCLNRSIIYKNFRWRGLLRIYEANQKIIHWFVPSWMKIRLTASN